MSTTRALRQRPGPDLMSRAAYVRLRSGALGLRVYGPLPADLDEPLRVRADDGTRKTEVIERVLWRGHGIAICTILPARYRIGTGRKCQTIGCDERERYGGDCRACAFETLYRNTRSSRTATTIPTTRDASPERTGPEMTTTCEVCGMSEADPTYARVHAIAQRAAAELKHEQAAFRERYEARKRARKDDAS